MSAVLDSQEAWFEPMTERTLDAVLQVERRAYEIPWTRGNFTDSLAAGYQAQLLRAGDDLLGYFVAMKGFEEVHLLNITVAPEYQRQGWARVMLDGLAIWSRGQGAEWLWLEVRASNRRAIDIYEQQGYRRVGERKDYYPARHGRREGAIVMSLLLRPNR
jgi:ribosomal-protein-alanine N-acetyltransferase